MNKKLQTFLTYLFCVIYSTFMFGKLLFFIITNGLYNVGAKVRTTVPPILQDKKWGTHRFINLKKQGVKLHYVEKGDKSKPLMLFLHGFPLCWFSWRHQLQEFSSEYWVVAVDLRGYGESDKPSGKKNYAFQTILEDIRELLIEFGKPKCILVGHDWGGALTWSLVDQYPELFDVHINLNSMPIKLMKNLYSSNLTQFIRSWYNFFFQCPWLPEIIMQLNDLENYFVKELRGPKNLTKEFSDDVIEGYKYYFSQKGAFTPPINYYRNKFSFKPDSQETKIRVPTLIIWGMEDVYFSNVLPKRASALCTNVKLEEIPTAGHFVQEEAPQIVNQKIWKYLSSQKLR